MSKLNIKISLKIISVVLFLMFVCFSCFYYFVIINYPKDLKKVFFEKSQSTANSLSAGIHQAEDLYDAQKMILGIQKNMWLDADIIDIEYNVQKNNKFITISSNNNEHIGNEADIINKEAFDKNILISKYYSLSAENRLKVVAPIFISGQTVGTVEVDFTMENIDDRIQESINKLLLIFLTISALSFIILYLLLRIIIIKPIKKINNGIYEISQNNLAHEIDIKTADELGLLAKAFNNMTSDLKKTREDLYESNKNLEKKVSERTSELQSKMNELKKFNDLVIDRELKMVELKERIEELEGKKK